VTISPEKQLIHSKDNGDGFVDTPQKLEKVFQAIEKALAKA